MTLDVVRRASVWQVAGDPSHLDGPGAPAGSRQSPTAPKSKFAISAKRSFNFLGDLDPKALIESSGT